jgi:NAD(P)-dependent dehydrogenase (short-subunit alcohol dehydrogenase family)
MQIENVVLITGASTGIGRACALHMDRLGWRVFAGVRAEADAASLREEGSERLTPVHLDVTDPPSVGEARRVVLQATAGDGLAGLVNNAGIPYGGPLEFLDLDEIRAAFEVNYFGVIAVTQAFIPLLRLRRGSIVNISSISGRVATPFLSPYSTSKFALEALSDALRVELHPWGIQVAVVEPGAINTPIWNKGIRIKNRLVEGARPEAIQLYGGALDAMGNAIQPHGIGPEHVARAVAHALTAKHAKTRYPVGRDAHFVQFFRFLPDRLRDRLMLSRLPKWG